MHAPGASLGAKVFPTHVGVFPPKTGQTWHLPGLPHARGGVSERHFRAFLEEKSSPRTWGCFLVHRLLDGFLNVFPTHVGVFLSRSDIAPTR